LFSNYDDIWLGDEKLKPLHEEVNSAAKAANGVLYELRKTYLTRLRRRTL
jgi:hypothetical protein